jgi:iron complex outermembrane recepter protein
MQRRLLCLTIAATLAGAAHAQDSAQPAQAPAEAQRTSATALDMVVVTGTRAQERTVAESLSPIDVISAEEVLEVGTPELQSALARFVPSYNFPRSSITDGSDHVRPAQLRGLAPDQTLVLINGKRRHRTSIINVNGSVGRGSSPVDLNAIPTSAIRSIEILRDGAAAQYGSDAIAGVINVILKDQSEGGSVDARWGEYDEGDGALFQVAGNVGLPISEDGFLNITAEWRDKDATNRSGPDRRQQYPLVNGQPDPREATFNRINHRFGDAETTDRSLFFNAAQQVGDNGEIYAFGGASNRQGESAGFYRRALDSRNILSIYPNGFLPLIVSDVDDRSFVGGVRGAVGEWDWDASYNFGSSSFDFNVHNSLNTSIGASSPTQFFAGNLYASQDVFNLDLRRLFPVDAFYGSLSLALGAEYREERFRLSPGDPSSYFGTGSQVFPGFRPSDATDQTRDNWSVYVDLESEVTERLILGVAGRYEDYSDFGSTSSGKLSGRFAFTDRFAVRATASNGFRAPNLQQQFYATTATNFIGGVPFDVRTFPVTSPVAQALGAEPLKAEESENFSIGLVAQPTDTLDFTVDFYRIDIDDRIVLSENLTGTAVTNFLAARGFPGVTGGRYFTNAIDTRTEGVDAVGRWVRELGIDNMLTLTLGYNRNDIEITRIAPNPAALAAVGLGLQRIGRVEIGRVTVGPPKDKWVLGGDWDYRDFSARLTATRYGEWQVLNANPAQDDSFSADTVLDVSLAYRWNDFTFSIGAENVTDEFPDQVGTVLVTDALGFVSSGTGDNSFNGILPYSAGAAPYGFNGRFYYARASYRF